MTDQIELLAESALKECMHLGHHERLLVVCDQPCLQIGQAFFNAGSRTCKETVMVQITPRQQNGNEPPDPVGDWLGQFDVAVLPTSRSLTHTQARRRACENGGRIATLPGITPDVFLRTMKTDWDKLRAATRRVATQLSAAKAVTIISKDGTDFTFKTGGRHAKADDGRINCKGDFGNLPAGEAYMAPLEGSGNGTIVFDGSFPLVGLLSQPLFLTVKNGHVTEVSGHPCGRQLEKLFLKYHQASRNIAEFGVGTLDTAIISGNVLEDEKVRGTVHIALGDNSSMGGTVSVPLHLDGIIRNPSVWLDNELWMDKGKLKTG